jgi:predicted RNA-binding Zn ribbon-like protein
MICNPHCVRIWRVTDDAPLLYETEPLSVRLMNTIWADRRGGHDVLDSLSDFRLWAERCGVAGGTELGDADRARARSLRDSLRRLAAAATDDDRAPAVDLSVSLDAARGVVNDHLSGQRSVLRQEGPGGFALDWECPVTGFDEVLARAAREGAELVSGIAAGELRACHGPRCVLYFVKEGARREWCSSVCGNRARVARHYRRSRV